MPSMTDLLPFLERPVLFIVCVFAAIPVYVFVGTAFYDSMDDFLDALRLFFQPNWLSALRGEWHEDCWQTLKLIAYMAVCAAMATALYKGAKLFF